MTAAMLTVAPRRSPAAVAAFRAIDNLVDPDVYAEFLDRHQTVRHLLNDGTVTWDEYTDLMWSLQQDAVAARRGDA